MRKSNLRATAGWQALALLGAGVFAVAPAYAQDAPPPASNETQPPADQQPALTEETQAESADEAVTVTGTRLVRPELSAPSPVTTVDSETFDLTGTVTVETLLNELPQLIPGNTRTSNNQGGEDFSTLDLRGIGPNRTLILVDGERVPASSTTGVVDIGTIPAGLIERVDVVTGGASAVYGSDAMAGVVNFILKDNFEGLEVTGQYGISEHGDGAQMNVQGLLGGNFADDRGNLTLFASYFTRESVGQGDRDVTRDAAAVFYDCEAGMYFIPEHLTPATNPAFDCVSNPSGTWFSPFGPGGSATPPWGWITNNPANAFTGLAANPLTPNFASWDHDCNPATPEIAVNTGNLSFNDFGELTPRNNTTALGLCQFADRSTGSSRYNFNPVNFLVTPFTRLNFAMTGRYDISDAIRLKTVVNYTDSEQIVNLAPTPVTGIVINPLLSPFIQPGGACGAVSCHPDLLAALNSRPNPNAPFTMDRRFSETGPRVGTFENKTATLRGTLSGPLAHGFNWDATLSYGRADQTATLEGNTWRTGMLQGLQGCSLGPVLPPGPVAPGSFPGCIPIDIFGPDTLTPDMIAFVSVTTKETRFFDQARVAANITGNLVELPAGPVGIAVGAEARTDRGQIRVDNLQKTGDIYGFNATQDQKGKLNVKELYGEIRVPILADLPFVHEFSVEAGARFSDYSSVGGLFNWKLGGQFSPVDWLKFRAIFNKAARAPSVIELFQSGDQGFATAADFCAAIPNADDPAGVLALCQAQVAQAGGPPAFDFTGFTQNNSQLQVFAFGNPGLSEETANTFTIGAVLTPNLGLGRFSATVDYYDIDIKDFVQVLGAVSILAACEGSLDPNDPNCLRITRNPVTGQVQAINTTIANSGRLKTSGVDAQLNFTVPFNDLGLGIPGRLRVQEIISWLDKFDFNGTPFEGTTGGGIGGSIPEWKSTLTAAYDSDDFTAQLRWNWQSDLDDIAFSSTAQVGVDQTAPKTPGLSYFDLSLRKSIGNNFELTGIVQNMFNQKARKTVAGFGAEGGVDAAYWNPVILGRFFQVQAKVKM